MAIGINSSGTTSGTGTALGVKYDPIAKTLMLDDSTIVEAIKQTNQTVSQLREKVDELSEAYNNQQIVGDEDIQELFA